MEDTMQRTFEWSWSQPWEFVAHNKMLVVVGLALVLLAASVVAYATLPAPVREPTAWLDASLEASSARWTGLGTYYAEKAARTATLGNPASLEATTARWTGLGNYYAEKAASTMTARYQALGEYYLGNPASLEATTARWTGLGNYYAEKAASAMTARYQAMGEYFAALGK
jgi:endo-beta-N-acetylglucosaminidase D